MRRLRKQGAALLTLEGGDRLCGAVEVSGAKNATLPIMAASLLQTGAPTVLENIPHVEDVFTLETILEKCGAKVGLSNGKMTIDASHIHNSTMPDEARDMRASILVAGPLLVKFRAIEITEPGGCAIGKRPIDWHLESFRTLGAKIEKLQENQLRVEGRKLRGATIRLPYPSVGVTENIMSIASLVEGRTVIENAAREPEIVDLAGFLSSMGANIKGAGSTRIKVTGVRELQPTSYTVIPDRIEACTYIIATAVTGGEVEIHEVMPEHLTTPIKVLNEVGVKTEVDNIQEIITIDAKKDFRPVDVLITPYPGYPTDMQPLLIALLSLAKGTSAVTETVFPERFGYVSELRKLGANIWIKDGTAIVKGVEKLSGADVYATDLRGGMALVLSGLAAEGFTTINNVHHIDRGYERIDIKLQQLGAKITRKPALKTELPENTAIVQPNVFVPP